MATDLYRQRFSLSSNGQIFGDQAIDSTTELLLVSVNSQRDIYQCQCRNTAYMGSITPAFRSIPTIPILIHNPRNNPSSTNGTRKPRKHGSTDIKRNQKTWQRLHQVLPKLTNEPQQRYLMSTLSAIKEIFLFVFGLIECVGMVFSWILQLRSLSSCAYA